MGVNLTNFRRQYFAFHDLTICRFPPAQLAPVEIAGRKSGALAGTIAPAAAGAKRVCRPAGGKEPFASGKLARFRLTPHCVRLERYVLPHQDQDNIGLGGRHLDLRQKSGPESELKGK